MTALWIVLGILLFFAILLSFSITVYIKITDEVEVSVGAFGYKKNISLDNEKSDKDKKNAKKSKTPKLDKAKNKITHKKTDEKSFSETVDFAITLIKSVLPNSIRMLKHIRFTKVGIFIRVSENDAGKTAIAYGKWNASIYTLIGVLDSTFKLKLKHVDIIPDFVREESEYDISFKVKLRFVHILFGGIGIIFKIIVNTLSSKSSNNQVENPPTKKKAVQ